MKLFFDTNLFIYLWEGEESPRAKQVRRILGALRRANGTLATSTLSLAEILVHPLRKGAHDTVESYIERFQRLELIAFDATCSLYFAEIRARHSSVKPPDAIQLASARRAGCDWFLTNDSRLSALAIPGIGRCASFESFPID